ncbi:MAG: helix-turn-helix domain-containing protein [Eubacteriales bacterium]
MIYLCNIDTIINRIKELSKQRGITQTYLCKVIGKRATFLSEVKHGKDNIDENEINAIAKELHTTPEYLKGETDDSKSEESTIIVINKSPVKRRLLDRIATMNDDDVQAIENLLNHFANGGKK